MYTKLPSIQDTPEEIEKFKYNFRKAWEFDFQDRSPNEKVMRGLFQSAVDANDKCWREIALLQKIA